ncbi:asparagine--tRNA ligase [Candidatus Micrarchaeota archaeon]|nr:asparagine--tRNA ligase [Candidatus Micrarchaeota archaeon]
MDIFGKEYIDRVYRIIKGERFIHTDSLAENVGKDVWLRGWVYRIRSSSNYVFVILRDVNGIVQCIVTKNEVDRDTWERANGLYIESSFLVKGEVVKDERAPTGYEIHVKELYPVCVGEPFPISKDLSTEFLLDVRHLWVRSRRLTDIFKVRHYTLIYLREFFNKEGFFEIPPPIITKNACEGGSQVFQVDYFGEPAYLSESGQLYAEAFIYSHEKVYLYAPSFRAERSRTVRHLAEYWHLEPEAAWMFHDDNIRLQERMIEHVIRRLVENHGPLLEKLGRSPDSLKEIRAPFPRITYDEMVDVLNKKGLRFKWGDDPGADEEKALTQDYDVPLVIERYPRDTKAFYMKVDPDDERYVLNDDVLAPQGHGEIIGGSERIWDLEELIDSMKRFGLDPENPAYKWYVDLRRYGSVPHSGFGLGIERFLKWILNLDHIRDAIAFPRTINRVYP